MQTLHKVLQFHRAFNRPINEKPNLSNHEVNLLRLRLLREEVDELQEALIQNSPVDVLDALTDIQYILDGTYISLGFYQYKTAAFDLVHLSNMAKLGPDGKPIIRNDGKILKPLGWLRPNLSPILPTK